jgi:hypothetical protein
MLQWHGELEVGDESWRARANEPLSDGDLHRLRLSAERKWPFDGESWTRERARRLGVESALRSRGRPRKDRRGIWVVFHLGLLCPLLAFSHQRLVRCRRLLGEQPGSFEGMSAWGNALRPFSRRVGKEVLPCPENLVNRLRKGPSC